MADRALSTSRRALLGAAASLPVLALPTPVRAEPVDALPFARARAVWNCRLARYRRLAAETEEAATTGWFAAANACYKRELAGIAARFGSRDAAESDEARRLRRAAFERVDAAEEAFWERCTDPTQKAAVALALTPAPDLPALAAKLRAMRTHQLHELPSMTRNCFDLLEEDVERLATRN